MWVQNNQTSGLTPPLCRLCSSQTSWSVKRVHILPLMPRWNSSSQSAPLRVCEGENPSEIKHLCCCLAALRRKLCHVASFSPQSSICLPPKPTQYRENHQQYKQAWFVGCVWVGAFLFISVCVCVCVGLHVAWSVWFHSATFWVCEVKLYLSLNFLTNHLWN